MERGFIRAEVISYHDLVKCGSLSEARKKGLLRLEGKNYIVQDGDVITFLFNVWKKPLISSNHNAKEEQHLKITHLPLTDR